MLLPLLAEILETRARYGEVDVEFGRMFARYVGLDFVKLPESCYNFFICRSSRKASPARRRNEGSLRRGSATRLLF